jgi:hypothetical protein
MKNKKIMAPSSPAILVKSTSSYVALSSKKCDAPAVFVKLMSLFALSGTAGCKRTGCEDLMAGIVYKLECYHCE